MKPSVKTLFALTWLLPIIFAAATTQAMDPAITALGNADLSRLAQAAAREHKQVMILYYEKDCALCNDLELLTLARGESVRLLQDRYALFKTRIDTDFEVVCPNGDALSESAFLQVKGVRKLPALLFTDRDGNVTAVENDVDSVKELLAIADRYTRGESMADGLRQPARSN